MSYLGVDLHTNSFTVCRRTKQDKESIRTFPIARIADFRKTLDKVEKGDAIMLLVKRGSTGFIVVKMTR